MRLRILSVLTFMILNAKNAQSQNSPPLLDFVRKLASATRLFINSHTRPIERSHRNLLTRLNKSFEPIADKSFPCQSNILMRSATVPDNVHKLRPGDIDIIGAIGDSLTAGFGVSATDLFEVLVENRGRSFSAGGKGTWQTAVTLPNILKIFNPFLYGYSTKSAVTEEMDSRFNVAEGLYTSDLMPGLAERLVMKMESDPNVNITKDWKMITSMVGDNDFCYKLCYIENPYDLLDMHKEDLLKVLRIFKKYLPRTIVNIVPPPNLRIIWEFTNKSPSCQFFNRIECPCIFRQTFQQRIPIYVDVMTKWQQMDIDIAGSPEFDTEDFTVIPHTFFLNFKFPSTADGTTDYGYLAPDCFHLSERGQSQLGFELWTSIMEPYYHKRNTTIPFLSDFKCPTEMNPYIPTRRNSAP